MEFLKPTLNCSHRAALHLDILTLLVIIVLSGTACSKRSPLSPLRFGHFALPTSTNANLVSVPVTNESDFTVVYLTCPLQVNSNGIWSGPTLPPRQKMKTLLAGQSGVLVIDAASRNQNTRVPVLWGYKYAFPATRWQEFCEDLSGRINGRGGRGFLYTNYLTDLKP